MSLQKKMAKSLHKTLYRGWCKRGSRGLYQDPCPRRDPRRHRRGLTLIELAIVILVLGIIMAIIYGAIDPGEVTDDARRLQVKNNSHVLQIQLQRYELENPPLEEGSDLTTLLNRSAGWAGLKEEQVVDPWKNPYFICLDPDGNRHICSYGSDGELGGQNQAQDFYLTDQSSWPAWLGKGKGKGSEQSGG